MPKKILFILLTLFLIQQSYNLLSKVDELGNTPWLLLIFFAWFLNMCVTGVFAFSGFAFPTQKLLPDSYYKIKNSGKLKKWFRRLKGEWFRKFLLATVWRDPKQRAKHFDGTASAIPNLILQSKKSEFGHLLPFIILTIASIYMIVKGLYAFSIMTFLWNFIGNFYPILLQRHHRMRVDILRRRML